MDEEQIRLILLSNSVTRPYFGGIVSHDELHLLKPKSKEFYIVNTDYSTGEGIHWVVLFFDEHGEFFDSLGKLPINYSSNFRNCLISNRSMYMFCTERLQSVMSSVCGQFCIYFAYYRCKDFSFVDIISSFSSNLNQNDMKVELFTQSLVKSTAKNN